MSNQLATQNGQVAASQQRNKMDVLKSVLSADSVKQQFINAMGNTAPSFTASIIELFGSDKYLQNCDPNAVIKEALKAAILKLPINKSLGFGYIIAYNNAPTFIIGYKGLIQLAIRSGQYKNINAGVVYEGEFKGIDKISGTLDINGVKESDKVVGYFAYIEMLGGFSKTLYSTKEDVIKHAKKYSKSFSSSSSAWSTDFDAMATKTVLRNLLTHYGLLSIEMQEAIGQDIDGDSSNNQSNIPVGANSQSVGFEEATYEDMGKSEQNEAKEAASNASNVTEPPVKPEIINNAAPAGGLFAEPQKEAISKAAPKNKDKDNCPI